MSSEMTPREDLVARLVRLIDEPRQVPPEIEERVRASAYAAWQSRVRRRRRRQLLAVAASLPLMLGLSWWLAGRLSLLPPTWERSNPDVHTRDAGIETGRHPDFAGLPADAFALLKVQQDGGLIGEDRVGGALTSGWLETGEGRAALRLVDGSSLRLDHSTRLELLAPDRFHLASGAIYLDASGDRPFTVETPHGTVRDIGTQFEVHLRGSQLRVRVREGSVDVAAPGGREIAAAGVELHIDGDVVSRRPVALHGAAWQSYLSIAPAFPLEGASLRDYLEWLRRETGWELDYLDPSIASTSGTTILHGSLEGVPVARTPELVLRTCGLGGRLDEGVFEIFRLSNLSNEEER